MYLAGHVCLLFVVALSVIRLCSLLIFVLMSNVCKNWIVLCWNVRGLNNPAKRKAVREFVTLVKANLVCLQETKLDVIDQFIVMQCVGPSFDGFAYLPAEETRGGILLAWETTVITIDHIQLDSNFFTSMVTNKDGEKWWISAVYAP